MEDETNIKAAHVEQIGAFGKPFRDPRGHLVTVAYFGIVDKNTVAIASDDAKEVQWFSLKNLPELHGDPAIGIFYC